jgi:sec-independent protein translocase protein TatA
VELAFLSPSPMELMVIAVIALIVLGPTWLPDAARSVGKGMREMRDSFQGFTDDDDDEPHVRGIEDEDLEDDPEDDEVRDDEVGDDDSHAAPAASPGRS